MDLSSNSMRRRVRQIVEEKVLEEEDEGTAELMK
jgi:hypothetical protein